jgi:D-alanyl-lipoteichoic acid acyltransferase DltB (MBOAT superfamily)
MTVPSWQFLVFVLVGAAVFNARSANWWRQAVWLVLNLAFVWSFAHSLASLVPFAGFLLLGYAGTETVRRHPHGAAPVAIILMLAVFIWLKRYSFIPAALLLPPGAMTVGLSYVFFRVMHLLIDARLDPDKPIGFIPYLNFTLNFPAFVSGPIQRREDYLAHGSLPLNLPDIGLAAWRMVLGTFKVFIVSDSLHTWQLNLIALPQQPSALTAAMIVVLYPLFLYANFSGYTDFVIGVARLYRLGLPENFDRPFLAPNFIEFWGRWHISLSQWLRSYVFNPLLMGWIRRHRSARSKQYPVIVALFITFFLVGAWHGPTSEFLFFGLLQGGGVAGNRLFQFGMARWLTVAGYDRLGENPLYRALARGLTFAWFAFTLLWFWATWSQIAALAQSLNPEQLAIAAATIILGASAILAIPDGLGSLSNRIESIARSRYTRTAFASAMLLAIGIAGLVLNMGSPEIVYKQF